MKWYRILLVLLCTLALSSCDQVPVDPDLLEENDDVSNMTVTKFQFSPDYKYMTMDVKTTGNTGPYILNDSSKVSIDASLGRHGLFGNYHMTHPQLKSIRQLGSEVIDSINMKMLVLVDLCQPQHLVKKQLNAVIQMRNLFSAHNLYLAFMHKDGITVSLEATDYILNRVYTNMNDGDKMLYRCILEKLRELTSPEGKFSDSEYHTLLVFSDNKVYDNNEPIDPQHYETQEQLLQLTNSLDDKTNVCYVRITDNEEEEEDMATNIIKLICKQSNGYYTEHLDWSVISNEIFQRFHIDIPNYRFELMNEDGKVFKGNNYILQIDFHDNKVDTLITSAMTYFRAGSVLDPIIVHGDSTLRVIVLGTLWTLVVLLVVFVFFQFLLPYVQYQLFKRKYVVRYSGKNMMFDDHPVQTSCYYCKTPFQEGDEIVVKCEHTVHKACWDEIGYHCPEYGITCKKGSHYYNIDNLFDKQNVSFYMKWSIVSILAGFFSWIFFTIFNREVVESTMELFGFSTDASLLTDDYAADYSGYFQLPVFGIWVSFFTTFFLSLLTVYKHSPLRYVMECFIRGLLASIGGCLSFGVASAITFAVALESKSFLLSWLPWPLAGCIIAFFITYRTPVKFSKLLVLVSLLLGLISMFTWSVLYDDSMMDFREMLLISHIVFALVLGLFIAKECPRSTRFFLRAENPGKGMDIALYKWLNANPDATVAIGRSVYCQIHMSWDYDVSIAPVQAVIQYHRGHLCLIAKEPGVVCDNKDLLPDEPLKLYHGTRFVIGQTIFTYIEKDKTK